MYRIEVKPGEEAVFRTIEELATGIRNGFVTPRARIYHAASQKWLPIEFHPHYKRALEGTFTPTPPTPQPSLAEMPAPTFAFPSAAPAPASSSTAPNPPASPMEPAPVSTAPSPVRAPSPPSGQGTAHGDRGSGVSGARDACDGALHARGRRRGRSRGAGGALLAGGGAGGSPARAGGGEAAARAGARGGVAEHHLPRGTADGVGASRHRATLPPFLGAPAPAHRLGGGTGAGGTAIPRGPRRRGQAAPVAETSAETAEPVARPRSGRNGARPQGFEPTVRRGRAGGPRLSGSSLPRWCPPRPSGCSRDRRSPPRCRPRGDCEPTPAPPPAPRIMPPSPALLPGQGSPADSAIAPAPGAIELDMPAVLPGESIAPALNDGRDSLAIKRILKAVTGRKANPTAP